MKTIKAILVISLCLIITSVNGQTYQDVLRYSQPQFNGTARATSMGGAFGSLGGDYSSLSINPAGIATYRSSEFSFTPSLNQNDVSSSFNGENTKESNLSVGFNQIGYISTNKPMRAVKKGLVSTHFGIGYNQTNDFNYKSVSSAHNVSNSMADMFCNNGYGVNPSNLYDNYGYPYSLTGIAYDSYLLDASYDEEGDYYYYTSYLNEGDLVNQTKVMDKKGYSGEINLTFGANISNRILLGASLNFAMLKYNEVSNYYEQFSDNNEANDYTFDNYNVRQYLDATGNGVNLKVGAIIKPTNRLRVGVAYHSPTWYNMSEDYGASIEAYFFNAVNSDGDTHTGSNYDLNYSYKFNTPQKLIGSISYVFGKKAILSIDYQYIDYTQAKFKSDGGDYSDLDYISGLNDMIDSYFKATHNYSAGFEYRINNQFSFRLGYSLLASPTDIKPDEYTGTNVTGNYSDTKSYSAGLGYRYQNFFLDFAYRMTKYSYDYYNYSWVDNDTFNASPLTTADITKGNYMVTLGWKF